MKVHLRADKANGIHTKFSVFVNGAKAGTLEMREDEACSFHQIVAYGCSVSKGIDEFISRGEWVKEEGIKS